jgi:hypothetical protein
LINGLERARFSLCYHIANDYRCFGGVRANAGKFC